MKALSIHRPWGWLFFEEYFSKVPEERRCLLPNAEIPQLTCPKDVENRGSRIAKQFEKYKGPLLIHVSKNMRPEYGDWCDWFGLTYGPTGVLLGIVDVVKVRYRTPVAVDGRWNGSHWHERGQFGIYVTNQQLFDYPIEYKGMQGVFNVPNDILPAWAQERVHQVEGVA